MIVVHITGNTEDAAKLSYCYDGLANLIILKDVCREKVEEVLKLYPHEKVMFLGHGSRDGLFDCRRSRFIIDKFNVDLLKERTVIGIWCYAAEFADKHELRGFFTSMFISNMEEALMNSFINETDETIESELNVFCININNLLKEDIKLDQWVDMLQLHCNKKIPFVSFNYEALTYFE
jgi:hypothetical protein